MSETRKTIFDFESTINLPEVLGNWLDVDEAKSNQFDNKSSSKISEKPVDEAEPDIEQIIESAPSSLYMFKDPILLKKLMAKYGPHDYGLLSFILLKDDSNATQKPYDTDDLEGNNNFTNEDLDQYLGITVSAKYKDLPMLSDAQIDKLLRGHLRWIFSNEAKPINEYKAILAPEVKAQLKSQHQNILDKILLMLAELIQAYQDLLKALLGKCLKFLVDEIRKLKITDSNKWRPYNDDGSRNEKYDPPFTLPIGGIMDEMFKAIEAKALSIDKTIMGFIKTFDWSKQEHVKEGDEKSFIGIFEYYYTSIKRVVVSMYTVVKSAILAFVSYLQHANAFLVGLYNGVLEFIAGILDLLTILIDKDKFSEFINGIKDLIGKILDGEIVALLKELFNAILSKYKNAKDSYEFLKYLGEDLAELIIEIVIAFFTAGASLVAKLKTLVKELIDIAKNPKNNFKDLRKKLKNKDGRKDLDDATPNHVELWNKFGYDDLFPVPPNKPKNKPCIVKGTCVQTTSGIKKVEDLILGEELLSYNFASKCSEPSRIKAISKSWAEKYLEISLSNSDIIAVTGRHLIWNPSNHKWLMAHELTENTDLFNGASGNTHRITNLHIKDSDVVTFNIEVEKNGNYLIGKTSVLVHNASKVSKFASTEIIEVSFYKFELNGKVVYVGQTVQEPNSRLKQHMRDPKKKSWAKKATFDVINDVKLKMTPYEAHVREAYEMSINAEYDANSKKSSLKNKQRPISMKKFEDYKHLHNPCKFF